MPNNTAPRHQTTGKYKSSHAMRTSMKNIAATLATVLTIGQAMASGPERTNTAPAPAATLERELDRQIDKFVTYPLLERRHNMDGEVLVSFVIDTEGRVKVIGAHSANTALCEYVLRMLAKVDIGDNPDGLWKTTHMRFSFHPEV